MCAPHPGPLSGSYSSALPLGELKGHTPSCTCVMYPSPGLTWNSKPRCHGLAPEVNRVREAPLSQQTAGQPRASEETSLRGRRSKGADGVPDIPPPPRVGSAPVTQEEAHSLVLAGWLAPHPLGCIASFPPKPLRVKHTGIFIMMFNPRLLASQGRLAWHFLLHLHIPESPLDVAFPDLPWAPCSPSRCRQRPSSRAPATPSLEPGARVQVRLRHPLAPWPSTSEVAFLSLLPALYGGEGGACPGALRWSRGTARRSPLQQCFLCQAHLVQE